MSRLFSGQCKSCLFFPLALRIRMVSEPVKLIHFNYLNPTSQKETKPSYL